MIIIVFLWGCATSQGQLTNSYDLSNAAIGAVQMPVLKPVPRPLYIVGGKTLPSEVKLEDGYITLVGFDDFVTKSVQSAMNPFFESVIVAESDSEITDDRYFVADLTVESVTQTETRPRALEMRWSIGVRASEADEYSFAGAGRSAVPYSYADDLEARMKQLMEKSVESLLESWSDKEVMRALRNFDQAPADRSAPRVPSEDKDPTPGGPTLMLLQF